MDELRFSLAILAPSVALVAFLVRLYVKRVERENAELRVDRDYYRNALFHSMGLTGRVASSTEKLANVMARQAEADEDT